MTSKRASTTVFATLPGAVTAVPAGTLSLFEAGAVVQASRFRYGTRYAQRANAIEVDPVSLPLAGPAERQPAHELAEFGAIRDAAPDFWGRLVIERKLGRTGPLPESVYLEHAGGNPAGALEFRARPDSPARDGGGAASLHDLDRLVQAAERIEGGEPVPAALATIFDAGSSLGGARPKAAVLGDGRQWLAKFQSGGDRWNVPAIEYGTLRLARECGLQVPEVRLLRLAGDRTVMLIERFDRRATDAGFERTHFVSGLTMLGVHSTETSRAGYADLARVIESRGVAGAVAADRVELFGRMVFNILVSNDDDHLRNHGFLRDAGGGGWRLSPLYDVVPRPQVAHERYLVLGVGPRGRAATLDNAVDGSGQFGLTARAAAEIVDRIARVVRQWRVWFADSGIPEREMDPVATAFPRYAEIGGAAVDKRLRQPA
jgi:serine/threonine-protein kinase HipA